MNKEWADVAMWISREKNKVGVGGADWHQLITELTK